MLIAGEDDEMFMTRSQRYAKDNRTAHLTARNDKSVAYVTNNTSSSAVAKRPRVLHVCQYLALTVQNVEQSLLVLVT